MSDQEKHPSPIYLDFNASTPVDPRVTDIIISHLLDGVYGNPSCTHLYGVESYRAICTARNQIAQCLECNPGNLIFTSGATECLNFVLKGASKYQRAHHKRNHIIISAVEHPAVFAIAKTLEEEGFTVSQCDVNSEGIIDLDSLEGLLRLGNVALVSIIHANAEIGSIQPIHQAISLTRSLDSNALFHVDSSQTVGKIPVSISKLQPDFMTIAGHKLYAPKGIGCLYARDGTKLVPLIHGAGQERGLRGGTENVTYIAALGEACSLVHKYWTEEKTIRDNVIDDILPYPESNPYDPKFHCGPPYMRKMRQLFQAHLIKNLETMKENCNEYYCINGPEDEELRLPNTLSISFRGLYGTEIVSHCSTVAFSSGSACHASTAKMSDVLVACRVNEEFGKGTIRISTGRFSKAEDMVAAAHDIALTINQLYGWSKTNLQKQPSLLEQKSLSESHNNDSKIGHINSLGRMHPFESRSQWKLRQQFLINLLRQVIYKTDGDITKLKMELPRLAVLSSSFYNMKVLECHYDDELEKSLQECDPTYDDSLLHLERKKHEEKCLELNCNAILF